MTDRLRATPALTERLRSHTIGWGEQLQTLGVRVAAIPQFIVAALAVAVGAATWQIPTLAPQAGLDASWQIGLHLAAVHGLDYGRQIVYTFGPLGFLSVPLLVTAGTGIASFVFVLVLHIALAVAVVAAAARWLSWPLALLFSYVTLALPMQSSDLLLLLALVCAVWRIDHETERLSVSFAVGAGALAAVALLVKLNSGILCALLLVVAVAFARPGGWRLVGILLGSLVVVAFALWLVSGNDPTDLPRWLQLSYHVVASYTGAMAIDSHRRVREYPEAAILVLAGAILLWLQTRAWELRRRAALWLVLALFVWGYFKEGFVRHDGHALYFFSAYALAVLAVSWNGVWVRCLAVGLVAAAVGCSLAAPELRAQYVYRPIFAAKSLLQEAHVLLDAHRRNALVRSAKAAIRQSEAVDSRLIAHIGRQPVDVQPYEIAVTWAYDLDWHPQLLMQSYAAYDRALDDGNAREIADAGPEWILRQQTWPALDARHPAWEAPASFRALICHYRETFVSGQWELLRRARNRCGQARLIGGVVADAGEPVSIPRPPSPLDLVYATVAIPNGLSRRIELAVFKLPHAPQISLGDGEQYRLVEATAGDGLVVRVPASSGIAAEFGGVLSYTRLTVRRAPSPLRIRFYAQRLAPAPASRAMSRFTPRAAGRIAGNALLIGGKAIPVVPGVVSAHVDSAQQVGPEIDLSGWAGDTKSGRPADAILVFARGKLVAQTRPNLRRPDVAAAFGEAMLADAGYRLAFPVAAASRAGRIADVRVFAIAHGVASEADYTLGSPWPEK